MLPAHPSDTHQNFTKLSSLALLDVKEQRSTEGTQGFTAPKSKVLPKQLRATYPEVAQPGATPTPHLKKRTATGKRNCVFWFLILLLLLLTSQYPFSDRSQHFSKGHSNDLCSSQLFFLLTWGSGVQDSDHRDFCPLSKSLAAKQGENWEYKQNGIFTYLFSS